MNFILVILDSLRQDHVGAYGNDWIQTPCLDRFAQESTVLTRAYPESVPTLPFRTSLITGRRVFPFKRWKPHVASYPYQDIYQTGKTLSIPGWSPIDRDDTTLAEFFHGHGFTSAMVTDCLHQMYPGMNYNRGFHAWHWVRGQEWDLCKLASLSRKDADAADYFSDLTNLKHPKVWETERNFVNTATREYEEDYFSPKVFAQAGRWLEELYKIKNNFFLCVDSFDPHEPWDTPRFYRDLYADKTYRGKEIFMPIYTTDYTEYLNDEELKYIRACYASEVTMVDRWFGMFMDKVRLLGLDKNSLIIVVSDHGHQLGENGYVGKIDSGMLPCLMDLVMMIRHPDGTGAGKSVDAFMLNHDILPTVCSIMGLDIPDYAEGLDIWPVVEGKKDKIRDYVTSIFKHYVWVRTEQYVLIRKTDKSAEYLYDIIEDPEHERNIAPDHPKKVEELWHLALEDAGGDIPVLDISFPMLDREQADRR
ncbi:MAG: sulfatase [Deltaproteobacteria bacterium]|nr:sulfatase [Deltaproteobacteria bacterium]